MKQTRIIVLMTDGEANEGKTGDDLIAYADELKQQGYLLYTLGFFQDLTDKSEPQRVLEAMASNGHHYEVENAEDLVLLRRHGGSDQRRRTSISASRAPWT